MAQGPDPPLHRIPAGLVVGVAVALAVALAITVGIVGCRGGGGATATAPDPAATATAASPRERCVVGNRRRPVLAAFAGAEAYVACAQFAIQAPEYGGVPWTVRRGAALPPPARGRRVVCVLHAPAAAEVRIQDAGAAREGLAQCRRMRRDGWAPGPRP